MSVPTDNTYGHSHPINRPTGVAQTLYVLWTSVTVVGILLLLTTIIIYIKVFTPQNNEQRGFYRWRICQAYMAILNLMIMWVAEGETLSLNPSMCGFFIRLDWVAWITVEFSNQLFWASMYVFTVPKALWKWNKKAPLMLVVFLILLKLSLGFVAFSLIEAYSWSFEDTPAHYCGAREEQHRLIGIIGISEVLCFAILCWMMSRLVADCGESSLRVRLRMGSFVVLLSTTTFYIVWILSILEHRRADIFNHTYEHAFQITGAIVTIVDAMNILLSAACMSQRLSRICCCCRWVCKFKSKPNPNHQSSHPQIHGYSEHEHDLGQSLLNSNSSRNFAESFNPDRMATEFEEINANAVGIAGFFVREPTSNLPLQNAGSYDF